MPSKTGQFSIGDMARRTGVGIETIRYYEREGLLPKAGRTDGGHRIFGEDHLRRLNFIKRSRGLGFAGEDLRQLIDLLESSYGCQDVERFASKHLGSVRQRIRELETIETVLVDLLSGCSGDNGESCHIVDRLSASEPLGA